MTKITKTTMQLMLAAVLFASFMVAGCNNSSEEKKAEPAKDSISTPKSMEAEPAPVPAPDSTQKRDTAKTRPTPGGA
ncbi:MAG TPA: hypothetical protein PLZ45_09845 [Ferruginibacter sp.]|nr:hypothetical protein [Chitinophagaceae bacterium]HRI24970.1 hypothetical protein [Ferruginibacter sp.]